MKCKSIWTSLILCVIVIACVGQARDIEYGKPLPADLTLDELSAISWLNDKAKSKVASWIKGETKVKSVDTPSAREKYWTELRMDPALGYIPTHKYADAIEQIEQMSVNKRALTSPWYNVGPTTGTNKIVGGRTRSLVVFNSTHLLAGSVGGGIWSTTNGGSSWSPINDLLPYLAIATMANAGNIVYAGTGEGFGNSDAIRGLGIYKSTDYGMSWTLLTNTKNSDFYYVNKVAIVPGSNGNTLYAATGTGLWKSTDGGSTWVSSVSNPNGAMDVVVSGSAVVCWVRYYGIYYSSNSGSSFALATGLSSSSGSTDFFRGAMAFQSGSSSIVYSTRSSYTGLSLGFWKSTDGGASWTNILGTATANTLLFSNAYSVNCAGGSSSSGQGWYDNTIIVDPLDSTKIYVGGIDLWRSDDGGANWGMISTWWANPSSTASQYLHADQHFITFSADGNTMYNANDGGIYSSTNFRTTAIKTSNFCAYTSGVFLPLNNGYSTLQFYHGDVASGTSNVYVAGAQDNGSWRFSASNWDSINGGDGGYSYVDKSDSTISYVSYVYTSIYRCSGSTCDYNGVAESGTFSDGRGGFINPYIMDPTNSNTLYTCTKSLYKTTNANLGSSATWTSLGTIPGIADGAIVSLAISGSTVYLGGKNGVLFSIPTTGGSFTTWNSPTTATITGITYVGGIIYVTASSYNANFWKSSNGGATWTTFTTPGIPFWCSWVNPSNTAQIYAGTDLGVLYSSDAGATFASVNSYGLANVPVLKFSYQSATNRLFAWTHGRGAYYSDITVIPTTASATTSSATSSVTSATSSATSSVTSATSATSSATSSVTSATSSATSSVTSATSSATSSVATSSVTSSVTSSSSATIVIGGLITSSSTSADVTSSSSIGVATSGGAATSTSDTTSSVSSSTGSQTSTTAASTTGASTTANVTGSQSGTTFLLTEGQGVGDGKSGSGKLSFISLPIIAGAIGGLLALIILIIIITAVVKRRNRNRNNDYVDAYPPSLPDYRPSNQPPIQVLSMNEIHNTRMNNVAANTPNYYN